MYLINPFVPNPSFLYLLKTSENQKVLWCFQGVEKGCIENKWVKPFQPGAEFHIKYIYLIFSAVLTDFALNAWSLYEMQHSAFMSYVCGVYIYLFSSKTDW